MAAAIGAAALAAATLITAVVTQREATRPVGEGELFLQESRAATVAVEEILAAGTAEGEAVRRIRNDLGIEAVALVDGDARITAATSGDLVGGELDNPVLAFGLGAGRFMAVAAPMGEPVAIDGIATWERGDVLYQVAHPREGSGGLLLYYDVAELLHRRSQATGIRPATLQLAGAGVTLLAAAALLLLSRSRAARRYRETAQESELLRRHAAELEHTNRELAQARSEAERALALAEEKNRIRTEFVLMINHELRTPLTTVVTGTDLLRAGDLTPDEETHLVDAMAGDAARLQEMIDRMLAVARIENRGLDYRLRDVPLTEACAAIAAAHPGAVITVDPSRPLRLHTDPQTLSQLVASLVDNAFTHGARAVTASCATNLPFEPMFEIGRRPEHAVWFTIGDDGPGIDPEFLPRAFEKFEKRGFTSGTGLGLYSARLMVEAIEGSLAVTTSPAGTTMAVAVPLSIAVPAEGAA